MCAGQYTFANTDGDIHRIAYFHACEAYSYAASPNVHTNFHCIAHPFLPGCIYPRGRFAAQQRRLRVALPVGYHAGRIDGCRGLEYTLACHFIRAQLGECK